MGRCKKEQADKIVDLIFNDYHAMDKFIKFVGPVAEEYLALDYTQPARRKKEQFFKKLNDVAWLGG